MRYSALFREEQGPKQWQIVLRNQCMTPWNGTEQDSAISVIVIMWLEKD